MYNQTSMFYVHLIRMYNQTLCDCTFNANLHQRIFNFINLANHTIYVKFNCFIHFTLTEQIQCKIKKAKKYTKINLGIDNCYIMYIYIVSNIILFLCWFISSKLLIPVPLDFIDHIRFHCDFYYVFLII